MILIGFDFSEGHVRCLQQFVKKYYSKEREEEERTQFSAKWLSFYVETFLPNFDKKIVILFLITHLRWWKWYFSRLKFVKWRV